MPPMTGWSHQDDGDVTGLLFGASAVAATGIKPNGTAPVMSPLLRNWEGGERTGRHSGNCTSTTPGLWL